MSLLVLIVAAADGLPPIVFDPGVYLGPVGALAIALVAVGALWREDRRVYKERIADLTAQRDLNAAGWKEQTEANAKLAANQLVLTEAIEKLSRRPPR